VPARAAVDTELLTRLIERFSLLPLDERERLAAELSEPMRRTLNELWEVFGHGGQIEPPGDWRIWAIIAGRGFGKTRAGAEWVSAIARADPAARIALVGHTAEDVRRVMVEGSSGILAVARDDEHPRWSGYANAVLFENGARAFAYSAEAPEKLRGPEHHAAWCDELAKWRADPDAGDAAWDNLMMGLRLGERQRVLVTTTPRSVPLLQRVLAEPGVVVTRGRTKDNPHLPHGFVAAMVETYGGTRLGRQELDGELIEDAEGTLWPRAMIERCRVEAAPALVRVVVGVDPPAGVDGDACGIVACGIAADGVAYVIADCSIARASPEGWARVVADCAALHGADRVVAEKNNGGEMVRSVLASAEVTLPIRLVHASRGKVARAEPVAAL
jgi:phage terminase large subunit-like protein